MHINTPNNTTNSKKTSMSGNRLSGPLGRHIWRQKQPYKRQAGSDEPTHDVSGHGPLRTFDVFALIVNKMVGTGIYTAPASVFLITGNKSLTLGLFGIGFLYSLVRYVSLRAFDIAETIWILT